MSEPSAYSRQGLALPSNGQRVSGIYRIRNLSTGDEYVGSAVNIKKRWAEHTRLLRKGQHHSRYLQNAWNVYGECVFSFEVLAYCCEGLLLRVEQLAIDTLNPRYNMCRIAGSILGVKRTPETCEKIRIANTGYRHTLEARARMSEAKRGRKESPEAVEKRAAAHRGRKNTVETIAKMRAAKMGHEVTAETRRKIGMAQTKITDQQVREIRDRVRRGESQTSVARSMRMSQGGVSTICRGRRFKWVTP